jgi:methanogenic corrinoid protein MtbC1
MTDQTPRIPQNPVSIGEAASASGISTETLRIWERRYGRPTPIRLPSGHRRYPESEVIWLRRMAEGLARGHRPGMLVRLSEEELDILLEQRKPGAPLPSWVESALDHFRAFRGLEFRHLLDQVCADYTAVQICDSCVAPLLEAMGRAWVDGEVDIRHEHYASDQLEDWLRERRRAMGGERVGPPLVLAALTGEQHGFGLEMVAFICAARGRAFRLLGIDTPRDEIIQAAGELNAPAVGVSVSLAAGGVEMDRRLADLRRALPQEIELIVGGAGARTIRRGPRGIFYVNNLAEFDAWLAAEGQDQNGGATTRSA